MNVSRPPCIGMILPGIGARSSDLEAIHAVLVREAAAVAEEVGIQRRVVLIHAVPVPAGGVGLPDLNERVGQRRPALVEYAAGDDDPLSHRLGACPHVRRQVAVFCTRGALHRLVQGAAECRSRAGDLGQGMRQRDEWLFRSAARRGTVRLVQIRWESRWGASGTVHYGLPFPPRWVLAIANAAFAPGMPGYR